MTTILLDNTEWLVLGEQDGKMLLIAKDIIEKRSYADNRFCASWEESELAGYLGEWFLLSTEEAQRYFADEAARIAYYNGEPRAWWLRDTGIKNHAAFIDKQGRINTHGYRVDCPWCGVRPARWVSLES